MYVFKFNFTTFQQPSAKNNSRKHLREREREREREGGREREKEREKESFAAVVNSYALARALQIHNTVEHLRWSFFKNS